MDQTLLSSMVGAAAGAAMLQTPGTALCRRPDVERFYALLTDGSAAGTIVG